MTDEHGAKALGLGLDIDCAFRVQEVPRPGGGYSYAVYNDVYQRVPEIERYLRYLDREGYSPNTVKAYATALKWYWTYLLHEAVAWTDADSSLVSDFAQHLYRPYKRDNLVLLDPEAVRAPATTTLYRAAVRGFYEHAESHSGPKLNLKRTHGPRRAIQSLPQSLRIEQVHQIIRAQTSKRDRLLFGLLAVTGIRVGAALTLRHEDFHGWDAQIVPTVRDDAGNRARLKAGRGTGGTLSPKYLSQDLVRLYGDYMFEEFKDHASDYIFINLWSGRIGQPLTYGSVNDLVVRTRHKVGFYFKAHWLRHTFATTALEAGLPLETLAELMDHSSSRTTSDIYGHLSPEHVRKQMAAAGLLTDIWKGVVA